MRSPLVQLLTARRFAPLFVTQFLGAFNDNLLKSAMGIVVTFRLAAESGLGSASLVMLAGARLHRAVLSLLGCVGHARRSRRQVAHRPLREARRDRHHDPWRGGPLVEQRPAALRGPLLPRHALDCLWPDQIRPASAAPPRGRTRCRQCPHRGRYVPGDPAGDDSRRQRGPAWQRCAHRRRLRRPQRTPRLACGAPDPAGAVLRARCAAAPPSARHDRRRRARDVSSGTAVADSRGVVVLALWRHRRVRTAGVRQRRSFRERASGDDDAGAFCRWCRGRLDFRRAAAPRRSERALRADRGRRHGVLRMGFVLASAGRPSIAELATVPAFLRSDGSWRILGGSRLASPWRVVFSPCRSTPSCSTKASRHIARG